MTPRPPTPKQREATLEQIARLTLGAAVLSALVRDDHLEQTMAEASQVAKQVLAEHRAEHGQAVEDREPLA